MKNLKKVLSLLLAASLTLTFAACDKKVDDPTVSSASTSASTSTDTSVDAPVVTGTDWASLNVEKFEGEYVFKDSVSTLASNWNPHTEQTADDSYPLDFITSGLYTFYFNDELRPVEGKESYEGYVFEPEMAASEPVDVTTEMKAAHPEYNIPADAESGFAYTIDLNKDCVWENGDPINAETYVYSMKMLLDPKLQNYRAADKLAGDFVIANADNYYYQGSTSYSDNGVTDGYKLDDLTKDADGVYCAPNGDKMYLAVDVELDWLGGETLRTYVDAYGADFFDVTTWEDVCSLVNEDGVIPLTDENYALFAPVTTGNPGWGETEADLPNYFVKGHTYEDGYDFSNVGIFASGEYQITIVLANSLEGFYLLYNLASPWLVYQPVYDACLAQIEGTDAWTSTYCQSVDTTISFGPYKLTAFQADKSMTFERNENWWGYKDGKHVYKDPEDGLIYPMYQTTKVETQVVAEASTRKLMFLSGQLMQYGLQSEDFDEYRGSEYCYVSPDETIYFFIFNGYMDAIKEREAAADFDQTKFDLETMTLESFRKAVAVTYDKEALCTAVSPSRSGGYGLIGTKYIYDPETGARYRDTDIAKQTLCDFYSVDVSKFASLDDAVDSITGFDEVAAKELYSQAFNEALEKGFVTDTDGDGVCDQAIEIIYSSSSSSAFITKTLAYLNEKMAEVTTGTPFEGKITFVESAPLGNDWSTKLKAGLTDTVLGGWSGSALNPYSITDCYVNPSKQYDANWFDASKVMVTINVNTSSVKSGAVTMEDVTMSLKDWSDSLNGATVEVGGKSYNFGSGQADVDTRLAILGKIEYTVLMTYDYIPMLQNASMALLSQQVYYVIEDYNAVLGRGGITYMKYNYDETAWAAYVAEQGGELKY